MSSTAPEIRPPTATMTNGTRNQFGSSVGQRADRVAADRVRQVLGVRADQQDAVDEQDDRGDAGAERRPADDAAAGGERGR